MMQEADLSGPLMRWLSCAGHIAYAEIPVQGCCVDIVANKEGMISAFELKLSLSSKVVRQAMLNQNFADESWCVVPTKPRSLAIPERHGLGVIRITGRDGLVVMLNPNRKFRPFKASRERLIDYLGKVEPGGVGGLPSPVNDGPAQEVARLVAPLRRLGQSWKEIFESVPNHYANAASMASVMRSYGPARAILDGPQRAGRLEE